MEVEEPRGQNNGEIFPSSHSAPMGIHILVFLCI